MKYIEILRNKGLLDVEDENSFETQDLLRTIDSMIEEADFLIEGQPFSYYNDLYEKYGFDQAVDFIIEEKAKYYKYHLGNLSSLPDLFNLAVQKSNLATARKLYAKLNVNLHFYSDSQKINNIFNRIVSLYSPDLWFSLQENLYLVGLPEKECREILKNKNPNIRDSFYSVFGSDYKLFEDFLKDRIFLHEHLDSHVTADDVAGLGDLIIELFKKYGGDIFNFYTDIYMRWVATPNEQLEELDFKDQLRKLFSGDIYNSSIDPIYYPLLIKAPILNKATNEKIESVFDQLKENASLATYFYTIDFNPLFINNNDLKKWFNDFSRLYGLSESRTDMLKILGFSIKNFHLFLHKDFKNGDFNSRIGNDIFYHDELLNNEENFKNFFINKYNLDSVANGEIPFEYAPVLIMSNIPISKEYIQNNLELLQNAKNSNEFSLACFLINLYKGKKLDPDLLFYFNTNDLNIPFGFDYNSQQAETIRNFLDQYPGDKYNFDFMRELKNLLIEGCIYSEENAGEILLAFYRLDQSSVDKIKNKYNNSEDIWPFLIEYPNLIGLDANLIREKTDDMPSNSWRGLDIEYVNMLAIFGEKIDILNQYFKNRNPNIDLRGLRQGYHDLMSMIIDSRDDEELVFKYSSGLNYIDNFILKYFNELDDTLVKISLKYWSRLPDDLKKTQDKDIIFKYIKEKIVPELIGDVEVKHDKLLLEAFKWNQLDDYSNLEKLYEIGQKTPLPEWTNIGVIDSNRYKGYFLPRDDTRAMFIGNYVTCCQKIGREAEKSAIHSQASPFGALFVVENKKKKTLSAQSWVWSNENIVVFDNIESPSGKSGASYNEKAMNEILDIYKMASQKIALITQKPVFVGNSSYGIKSDFYEGLDSHRIHLVPEDSHVFLDSFYPKDRNYIELGMTNNSYRTNSGLYLDSYYDKRRLANNKLRILKISNKIDNVAVDIADKLERVLKYG